MKKITALLIVLAIVLAAVPGLSVPAAAEEAVNERSTPLMGWASWNNYHTYISESIIFSQMDKLVGLGLADLGYTFVNIDDGWQDGRGEDGFVCANYSKFPNGMKYVADYAHSIGLSAGIYTDAGVITCAYQNEGQSNNDDVGLYGHDEQDLYMYLSEWGFDFIKVDWCGGYYLGLDTKERYEAIGRIIEQIERDTGNDKIYNICCWEFPGSWATETADSWRVAGDITVSFESILNQIDHAAELARYCGVGHYNDLDMLQVGNGMTYEEDRTHFAMWCMLCSPLMLGMDLNVISENTLNIISNEELIAVNQDSACIQATVAKTEGDIQVWSKPLGAQDSLTTALAILNRSDSEVTYTLDLSSVGIYGATLARDLWTHQDIGINGCITVTVPAHGTAVYKVTGTESAAVGTCAPALSVASLSDDITVADDKLTDIIFPADGKTGSDSGLINFFGSGSAAAGVVSVSLSDGSVKDEALMISEAATISFSSIRPSQTACIYLNGRAEITASSGAAQAAAVTGDGNSLVRVSFSGNDLTVSIDPCGGQAYIIACTIDCEANADTSVTASAVSETDISSLAKTYSLFTGKDAAVSEDGGCSVILNGTVKYRNTNTSTAAAGKTYSKAAKCDSAVITLPASTASRTAYIVAGAMGGSLTVTVSAGEKTVSEKVFDTPNKRLMLIEIDYTADRTVNLTVTVESDSAVYISAAAVTSGITAGGTVSVCGLPSEAASAGDCVSYSDGSCTGSPLAVPAAPAGRLSAGPDGYLLESGTAIIPLSISGGVSKTDITVYIDGTVTVSFGEAEATVTSDGEYKLISFFNCGGERAEGRITAVSGRCLISGSRRNTGYAACSEPVYSSDGNILTATSSVYTPCDALFLLKAVNADGSLAAIGVCRVDAGQTEASCTAELGDDFTGTVTSYFWYGNGTPAGASYTRLISMNTVTGTGDGRIGPLTARTFVSDGAVIIDVRTPGEYADGHIEGSINIPYDEILTCDTLPDKDTMIITVCSRAKRSVQARDTLLSLGYSRVYVLGSIDSYYAVPSVFFDSADTAVLSAGDRVNIHADEYIGDDIVIYVSAGESADTMTDPVPVSEFSVPDITGNEIYLKASLVCRGTVFAETIAKALYYDPDMDIDVYLSDIGWLSSSCGWGTVNRNKSINGNTLSVGGREYEKGIGTHADSVITAKIPDGMTQFIAIAGCDDEVNDGSTHNKMIFRVYIDGILAEESPMVAVGGKYVFRIDIPEGSGIITLEVDRGYDNNYSDHADWCIAGFTD